MIFRLFTASDGKIKLKAVLRSIMSSDVNLGKYRNLGLILLEDYNIQIILKKPER
ncbi:hypothetical protein MKW94_019572 [Papaver nudicaule]|uniref:Uncharacterized protein n=1 Tax=Papaver nudicaule TaxID=74823 RepID=A0AA41V9M7_PAPNU|nr:hypothetical protein [Papaver nudicaule]